MIVTLLFIILVFILAYSCVSFVRDANKLNVRGPFPLPLVGNGLLFLGDTSNFLPRLGKLTEEYGDIFRVYLLSHRYIVTSNAEYTEPIVSSSELITKGDLYKYLHPWLGQGLLTSTGNRWKSHRKLLTPAFHFNILQSFLPIFVKNQKILNTRLRNLANEKSFDLFPVIALAALDNVSESAMGVSVNAQEDSESNYVWAISVMSEITMTRMFNPLMGPDFIFNLLPQKAQLDKALAILHGHTNMVIEERCRMLKESNITLATYDTELGIKKKCAFLDVLLLSEVDGKNLDMESVREEVDTFMFEGHDTTTSAISFILYTLSKNPGVVDKILKEQKLVFGDDILRDPTYSELHEMKYLELVIKEGLRLYPSVPLIARQITKYTNIAGYYMPKDTTVILDIYHMQRDPKYFENPLEFIPERFEKENSKERNVYSWIAFSAGPRNCIGQKFAMMEMKVALSSIIKNFKLLPSGKDVMLASDLILRSKNGIHIKLLPRS